jgi:hypothetical protein
MLGQVGVGFVRGYGMPLKHWALLFDRVHLIDIVSSSDKATEKFYMPSRFPDKTTQPEQWNAEVEWLAARGVITFSEANRTIEYVNTLFLAANRDLVAAKIMHPRSAEHLLFDGIDVALSRMEASYLARVFGSNGAENPLKK